MGTFSSFEEIDVWQESRSRAGRSVSANIAEGNDALTVPEFIQFLGHAKRSNAEVRSHYYDALDEAYITKDEFATFSMHNKRIGSMLASLIRYLQTLDHNRKRVVPHQENKQTRKPENQQMATPST